MLNEEQCRVIVDEMVQRFAENTPQIKGKLSFRDRTLAKRKVTFGLDPTWDLNPPLDKFPKFSSDLPRKAWTELRARLVENHFVIRVNPLKPTATQRTNANELEAVFNTGLALVEERIGYRIQEALADAQIVDGIGVLHWRKLEEIYPDYPEPELVEERPEEPHRYSSRRRNGYYEEKPESVRERRAIQQAKAGFPWHVEVMDITNVMWLDSDACEAEFVCVVKEIPYLRYLNELKASPGDLLPSGTNDPIMSGQEPAVIPEWSEIGADARIAVAQLWSKDEFYELAAIASSGGLLRNMSWKLIKSGPHPYEMPPFALVTAVENKLLPLPLRFQGALEGMQNLKEMYDRSVTLMLGLQEQAVIKKYWMEAAGSNSEPPLDESGETTLQLDSDSASAGSLPEGWRLRSTEHDVTPGFVQAVGFLRQEFTDAKPSTGRAEFSASTQPWAFRLAMQMENVEPKTLLDNSLAGIRKMVRNMALVMSKNEEDGGFGEAINVFAYINENGVDKRKVIGVEPRQIESLDVDVDINTVSGSERIAMVEHGRTLLNDPLVGLTQPQFYDEYMKVPNPDERVAESWAWKIFTEQVLPGIMKQEVASRTAGKYMMGPDGSFIGPDGLPVTAEQILAQNGVPVQPTPEMMQQQMMQQGGAPMPPGGGLPQPPNVSAPMNAVMPSMPGVSAPGTMPLSGLPG